MPLLDDVLPGAESMRIADPSSTLACEEHEVYQRLLPLAGSRVLELGCGTAAMTRQIAELGSVDSIVALEVDEVQHEKNLAIRDLPQVTFGLGGAEAIPAEDRAFDIVLMFKSLHHVPGDVLGQALSEIHRVLKPGGLGYISEPIFAGPFNDILRLFHDESVVRLAAFEAVRAAVADGLFEVVDEIFFNAPVSFADFADFETRIINATHSDIRLPSEVFEEVKARMEACMTATGIHFLAPMRIDLLRRPD